MNRKAKILLKALKYRNKLKKFLYDTSGLNTHTDHAGYMVAGLIIIALVIGWFTGFVPQFLSKAGDKIMGFFG
jgi:hypothetical protein